jgi:hypothetical protein
VSGVDQGEYSTEITTMLTRRLGWSTEEADNILKAKPVGDAKLETLLAVAREAAADAGQVADLTWQQALDSGWTAEQLSESFTCVLLVKWIDHFVNYGRIDSEALG